MTTLTFYLDNNINKPFTISVSDFIMNFLQSEESAEFEYPIERRINWFIARKYGTCDTFSAELWDEIYATHNEYKLRFAVGRKKTYMI
tara:strand:+ start:7468 stop:7731 length:264 start_codon:yes stop_codon:yes gene_type:complete